MKKKIFLSLTTAVLILFIQSELFTSETMILFDSVNNLHQTYNDCAPFCIKAVLTISGNDKTSVAEIKASLKWRTKNNYTIPLGLEQSLNKYGIFFDVINWNNRNTVEKISGLKECLRKKYPVIILVAYGKFQHYMVLLGYDDENFYVYDPVLKTEKNNPMMTVDLNAEKPGNRNMRFKELIDMWNKGGMYGLYKNYAISCHTGLN
jgi:hypothetical protein